MQHEKSIVDVGAVVGEGTRVWAFAHIQNGANVVAGCNVGEGVFIENGAIVGDNVTIKNGVQIWDGVILEDNVFVGPNATFCNDKYPQSKHQLKDHPLTRVCSGASIGANATILPGITVVIDAIVSAGSVATHDVSCNTIVAGNPAHHLRYRNLTSTTDCESLDTDSSYGIILPSCYDGSLPVRLAEAPGCCHLVWTQGT